MAKTEKIDVCVVGGGPGGILAAYHLGRNDVPCLVLEKGLVGESWRRMRPGMVLLSPAVPGADWTSLTLEQPIWAMSGVKKPFPLRDDFLCYLEKFVLDNGLNVRERCEVTLVEKKGEGFTIYADGMKVYSRFVVVATGCYSVPLFPPIEGIHGNPSAIHSSDYFHCMAYEGKKVLVVGGGNSAAEIAIELSGTSRVTLLTRGPLSFFTETYNLSDIRGLSESILKELIQFRIITHILNDEIGELQGGKVLFRSGREEEFDRVIFATGFTPFLPPMKGMTVEMDGEGVPVITSGGESVSAPGVFFAGSLAQFHKRCRFIHGFRSEVEKVTWAIFDRME